MPRNSLSGWRSSWRSRNSRLRRPRAILPRRAIRRVPVPRPARVDSVPVPRTVGHRVPAPRVVSGPAVSGPQVASDPVERMAPEPPEVPGDLDPEAVSDPAVREDQAASVVDLEASAGGRVFDSVAFMNGAPFRVSMECAHSGVR